MDFSLSPEQAATRDLVEKVCAPFDDGYWLARDQDAQFPHAFYRAVADAGLLGIAMPEAFGGSGLGIAEAAVMMQAIAESGAGMGGASAVHMNIFGLNPRRGVRNGGAEGAHAAAADTRRGEGLLRRDRA